MSLIPVDDGGVINVIEAGTGPTIVLLHGITLSGAIWHNQLEDLADEFRVVAVDLRGHGASTAGHGGYGYARMARDVEQVLDALGAGPATVVGHSMGGGVALTLAVSGSPSLAGLIVAGAVDGPGREFPGRRVAMSAGASASARTLQVLARRRSELIPSRRAARVAARIAFGSPADRADVDLTASTMAAMSRVNMAAMSSNMVDYDVRAGLATLTVPAVVVVGSRDRAAPPRRARAMAARIPGAELVVMDGAGHMLMLERRPAFNELARTFARRVSA